MLQPKTRHSFVEKLVDKHPRLQEATFTQQMLLDALSPPTSSFAMWLIGGSILLPFPPPPHGPPADGAASSHLGEWKGGFRLDRCDC